MDRFIVRWREDDRATWKSSSVMSKANADDNTLFLNAYGYTAKVCVAEAVRVMETDIRIFAEDINHNTFEEAKYNFDWVYVHGELEEKIGFDLVSVKSDKTLNYFDSHGDAILDVVVVTPNGKHITCNLYIWHSGNRRHGLICLPDDVEGNAFAKAKYEEKAKYL